MSEMTKAAKQNPTKPNHELSDAKLRPILWSGIGLFIIISLAFILMMVVFGLLQERREKSMAPPSPLGETRPSLPQGPRLQVSPELDLQQLNTVQDSLLNSYGWVVREAGVVRIPIEHAMRLMLERGFPVRPNHQELKTEDGGRIWRIENGE